MSDIAQAAWLLVEARRTGHALRELPDACKPKSADDVNAIIDAVTDQLDEPIGGWKIGFLYSPRQKPIICPLFASRLFDSPARVPLSLTPSLRIEPEISFRLLRDLPARTAQYRANEVADAIVACPSLEMVDTRFDTSHRSIRQMLDERSSKLEALADHNTTGAYIVGEGRTDWQDFDFAVMRVTMRTRGAARCIRSLRALLDERVPRSAVSAAAEPFRRLRTALLTDKDGLGGFGH